MAEVGFPNANVMYHVLRDVTVSMEAETTPNRVAIPGSEVLLQQ